MSHNKTVAKKKFIALTISTSLFLQSFSYYANAANEPLKILQDVQVSAELQAEATADASRLSSEIDLIENKGLAQKPIEHFDNFRLANQSIQIFDGQKARLYNLNDYQVEIPTVAYTSMQVYFNKQENQLIFEAVRGANNEGKNGVVVARQIIPNMNIKALVQDEEMLSFVDHEGRLHGIDMGFVTEQLFKSPIPVFQNLWEPEAGSNLKSKEFKLSYLTLGTKPFSEEQLSDKVVIPKNAKGEIEFAAGDIAVQIINPETKQSELLGVFSREVAYQRMIDGANLIQWLAVVASPNNQNIELAESILKEIETNKTKADIADKSDAMSPVVKQALRQIKPEQIAALMQAASRSKGLIAKRRGKFSLTEWKKDYEEIATKMRAEKPDVDEETITKFWSQGIEANEVNSPIKTPAKREQSAVAKALSQVKNKADLKLLGKIFAGATAAYIALPYAHDHVAAVEQIKVVSWMYEHFYPAVLKDAVYRTPLLLSTVSLIAIWPASVAMSAAIGKSFKKMSEKLQNSDSKMAQTVRDLAKNWGELNNWQRITSFGMRLYAWLIYPYWRVLSTMLRQKTFFTALENGLNPMSLIKKDSALGEKLGLTQDARIGLNNIFSSQADLAQKTATNLKLQGALSEQKMKIENMAWALASLVVCEKSEIDPSTLLMVATDQVNLDKSQLSEILTDPSKKREWEAIADKLIQDYSKMGKNGADISKIDPELFNQYYNQAQETAARIKSLPDWKMKILNLKVQFKKRARQFTASAIKIGKYDHEFLKKVYTNEFVSKQVQQEFSIDHLMVVGIVAFYGERADLKEPSQLAADAHGLLWTSKAHWNDIFLNTFAHFFVAGASLSMVFQRPKPQTAKSYAPKEDYLWVSKSRPQGFISGVMSWTKEVSNPLKADLGGIMLKRFAKRFTTFTAGLTMSVGLRTAMLTSKMGLAAAFSVAKSAWIFNFFAAQWFYGVVWDPIQSGNRLEGERMARHENQLKEARYLLSQGRYAEGHEKMMSLYFENNKTDLLRLELSVIKQVSDESLRDSLLAKKSLQNEMSSSEKYYFGLLSELAYSLQAQDSQRIENAENLLKQLIAKDHNLDTSQVEKLSAEALLKFSVANPPIYTEPNHVISWLSTWAGAVSSTVLAIPLSVILTTNSLMASPLFIGKWILISLAMYGISYLTLSKAMAERYIKFYQNHLADKLITKMIIRAKDFTSGRISSIEDIIYQSKKNKAMLMRCDALFTR